MHRLPQQLPAFLDLAGRHVVQAHEFRVLHVVFRELPLQLLVHRVGIPGVARRPRLREVGQPHLQPLVHRVGVEQAVQRGSTGARQPGDENGPIDGDLRIVGVRLERGLAE
ncbi:Uncharacterised protein [Mycobacteroides abscessus subsp. abscessus]|nr:Uncharacterised protein [Mycobacteroides abscessus subsp. abscessus]